MFNNKKILLITIILLGFILYANTLKNPYVWDDVVFVKDSNFIKKISNAWVFFSPANYFKYTQDLTYRPLPIVPHMAVYKICKKNPVGYRLSSVILHIINALLLFSLILLITKNRFISFLSGIIFIAHPLSTEAINVVSFNETLLSSAFFIASLLLYIKSKECGTGQPGRFARHGGFSTCGEENKLVFVSVICYFCAVFSKENVVVLPVLILLYDILYEEKVIFRRYIPFLIVTLFYLFIRFFIFRHQMESHIGYPGNSLFSTILIIFKIIPLYFRTFFMPVGLCADYHITIPESIFNAGVIMGMLIAVMYILSMYIAYKKSLPAGRQEGLPGSPEGKIIFFFLSWTIITFLPTSNIIPMQNIAGERYLYIPIMGLIVAVSLLIKYIYDRNKIAATAFAVSIILFLSVVTVIRNNDWKDEFKFYSKIIKQVPDKPGANINMGLIYSNKKDFNNALKYVNNALKLNPGEPDGIVALATVYHKFNEYDKALNLYKKALELKQYTYHRAPFLSMGIIYKIKKEYNKSIRNLEKDIELHPLSSLAYTHLAEIYEQTKDIKKAVKYYEKSIDVDPDNHVSMNSLAVMYGKVGNYYKAFTYLRKAVSVKPDSAEVHFNLGYLYYLSNKNKEALLEMGKVLKIDPEYKNAKFIITEIEKR